MKFIMLSDQSLGLEKAENQMVRYKERTGMEFSAEAWAQLEVPHRAALSIGMEFGFKLIMNDIIHYQIRTRMFSPIVS